MFFLSVWSVSADDMSSTAAGRGVQLREGIRIRSRFCVWFASAAILPLVWPGTAAASSCCTI